MPSKYPTKEEYLIQLENDQLRQRIKEYKVEIARLKSELEICKQLQKEEETRGGGEEG